MLGTRGRLQSDHGCGSGGLPGRLGAELAEAVITPGLNSTIDGDGDGDGDGRPDLRAHVLCAAVKATSLLALPAVTFTGPFDPDWQEFGWAPRYFGDRLSRVTTGRIKGRALTIGKDLFPRYLGNRATCYRGARDPIS